MLVSRAFAPSSWSSWSSREDGLLELGVRPLQVVVDDDRLEEARLVHLRHLSRGVAHPRRHALFALGAPPAQSRLECVEARRRDEEELGAELGMFRADDLRALEPDPDGVAVGAPGPGPPKAA